jgi:hypothetical protein
VQIACEELSGNTWNPSSDFFIAVFEALLTVRSLRTDRAGGLDRFYLGNLGVPATAVFSERHFDPEFLPHVVNDVIQGLRTSVIPTKDVVFAGRNLYVALREEAVSDLVVLNRSLTPFLGRLFRLAARGHWVRERLPIRTSGEFRPPAQVFEPMSTGPFQIVASVGQDGDLLLTVHNRGVRYPLGPYPEIREFEAMLHLVRPGQV